MAMLTAAIDCSQDKDRKYFVMAALVSSAEEWASFDRAWRERLAADGLKYFHMNPFAHATTHPQPPFDKTWIGQEGRRKSLLSDLLDIIQSHVFRRDACILPMNILDMMTPDARNLYIPSRIAFAAQMIGAELDVWRRREKFRNGVRLVFEQGDPGAGTVIDVITRATGVAPLFEPKKDNPDRGVVGFTPLQAADILAYEIQKITQLEGHVITENFRFRFPYQQLEKIPGDVRLMTQQGADIYSSGLAIMDNAMRNGLLN